MSGSSECRMSPELAAKFEREALPYHGQLLRAALQLTRHRQDAEDLVQDAIAKACAGFYRFTPGTNLRAWLHRILLNTFINGYRKRQRDPAISFLPGDKLPISWTRSAEESALSTLPSAQLVRALQRLHSEFRQVLYLIDVEGFSYRETAAIMNVPIGTVMSRLHRARTSMRELLTSEFAELFEMSREGQRMGETSQEVHHVHRGNGDSYRGGDTRYRGDYRLRNGEPAPSAAAAARP